MNPVMSGRPKLLEYYLPRWDFQESHCVLVEATPEATYRALWSTRRDELAPAYDILFTMRFVPERLFGRSTVSPPMGRSLLEGTLSGGPLSFLRLAEDPGREVAFGGVASMHLWEFWDKADQKTVRLDGPEQFLRFSDPDYLKVACSFWLEEAARGTWLRTQTRVAALSPSARVRFAPYWVAIRLGSGMVRKAWLEGIKRRAELGRE